MNVSVGINKVIPLKLHKLLNQLQFNKPSIDASGLNIMIIALLTYQFDAKSYGCELAVCPRT